ncbi:hypothetical protein NBRC10512_004988 [Rhodotorula toruloides]|uniref:RHTO0S01e14378g1_1 n=2 Tax=Rhodotorula toruloides TaxID=5286 RepID=A0A061AF02_RHOTO|nr:MFS myo-inositol transporter [Rhodotorula toruloides NP11]EMS24444.1 MFS myo-inositol transporter [Rhodotorula toruloides NP11]CDR36107.1 RHTO0S01e14378g1_1 [Rhodotorula toruloides]
MVITLASPRSSASDSLSPQQAAHSLSWSAPPGETADEEDGLEDVDEESEGRLTPALIRIAGVAGLGGLLFGFDTGVVSGALVAIGTDLGGRALTLGEETGIVTSALYGALAGSLFASRAADFWGRKPVIVAAAVLFALGALEQAAAQVYKEVILGRVLIGIGVGLSSMTLPIYLAEISPAKFRGRIVASLVVLITGGQVLAYIVDAIFYPVTKGWRWMFGFGAVPAVVQLLLSFSLPESPRFQLRHDRVASARKTIRQLNPTLSHAAVQRRIESIQAEVQGAKESDRADEAREGGVPLNLARWKKWLQEVRNDIQEGRLGRLWRDRVSRRTLLVAAGLQFFQQATGFNTLMYYSAKIIQLSGLGQPVAFAIVVALSNFLSTIVALRLIDRMGRRALLLRTLIGMIFGMSLLAFSFVFIHLKADDAVQEAAAGQSGPSPWAFVAILAMCIFCVSYALGIGNCAWVVQSEVFNQDQRAVGNGIATAVNWSANLLISSTFLHLASAITPAGTFALYSLISLAGWIFTWRYLPETKGLSLDEVRELFEREVGVDGMAAAPSGPTDGEAAYHVVGEETSEEEEEERRISVDVAQEGREESRKGGERSGGGGRDTQPD